MNALHVRPSARKFRLVKTVISASPGYPKAVPFVRVGGGSVSASSHAATSSFGIGPRICLAHFDIVACPSMAAIKPIMFVELYRARPCERVARALIVYIFKIILGVVVFVVPLIGGNKIQIVMHPRIYMDFGVRSRFVVIVQYDVGQIEQTAVPTPWMVWLLMSKGPTWNQRKHLA